MHGVAIGPRGGVAQEISVLNAIIGPVSAVSGAGSSAIVLGQKITSAGREPLFAGIRPGDVVAVSAQLQFSGSWSARRVAMLPSMGHFQLVAPLSAVGTGVPMVAGTEIKAVDDITGRLVPGERVIVTGDTDANGLVAERVVVAPINLGASGTRVEVVNYFRTIADGTLQAPDGMTAVGAPASISVTGSHPVEISGIVTTDNVISVDEIDVNPSTLPTGAASDVNNPAASADDFERHEGDFAGESSPCDSELEGKMDFGRKDTTPNTELPSENSPDRAGPELEPPEVNPELPDIEVPEIHGALDND